jgi:hypothetical protein
VSSAGRLTGVNVGESDSVEFGLEYTLRPQGRPRKSSEGAAS